MAQVGKDLKDHLFLTPLPWAGTLPLGQVGQEAEGRIAVSMLAAVGCTGEGSCVGCGHLEVCSIFVPGQQSMMMSVPGWR